LRKNPASPVEAESVLEARSYSLHSLARSKLAANRESDFTDHENAPARLRQRHATDENVGPSAGRIFRGAQLPHACGPRFRFEQRDLTTATSIDVAQDALASHQRRGLDTVHYAAVRALNPDGLNSTGHID